MATLERAVWIAAKVHEGQIDKAGAPYILHPLRLMMKMKSIEAMIVAVLHDVVEDSPWTIQRLRKEGFSEKVLSAIDCVTNRENESYDEFIDRASGNPLAREVKLADLEDNLNTLRISELQERDLRRIAKYHRSWKRLSRGR